MAEIAVPVAIGVRHLRDHDAKRVVLIVDQPEGDRVEDVPEDPRLREKQDAARNETGKMRVKDVARVELGAQNYVLGSTLDGKPAANIGIYQLPGANLIEISDQVQGLIDEMSSSFPPGSARR